MERILCAAIWYKEFSLIKDDFSIGFMRPVNVDRGIVFSGWRHYNCLYQMVAITGKYEYQIGESVQGFLTNRNRFVDRTEAFKIAKEANQILEDSGVYNFSSAKLFSEDLY